MHLFYSPIIKGNEIVLDEAESKHAVKVLRLTPGSRIHAVDGRGTLYTCEITEIHQRECRVKILNSVHEYGKKPFFLHIAIAPVKNIERLEWFLEKATEIGIDEITPILCEFSERKILKPERLEKILVSAMKQSEKARLPKLNPLTPFREFISGTTAAQKFIAHCHPGEKPHLKKELTKEKSILVVIGPEGDFSSREIEQAKLQGFREISLGNSRLRTETAALVACMTAHLAHE